MTTSDGDKLSTTWARTHAADTLIAGREGQPGVAHGTTSPLGRGTIVGRYLILGRLGEGGMGRVFLAERSDGHYQQQAAIKLLLGWSGAQALERLTRERQLLARLNHPHIAKLLDGGTTSSGQPSPSIA